MQLDKGGLVVWLITILKFSIGVVNSVWKQMPYPEYHRKICESITWNPLSVKTMLQSKLVTDEDIPEMYPQLKVIQKVWS